MITQASAAAHELIGLHARVASSAHKGFEGKAGRVVYETKCMLHIESSGRVMMIPKDQCVWEFGSKTVHVYVDGRAIKKRSHERLKN